MGDFHLLDVPSLTDNFNNIVRTEDMLDERHVLSALVTQETET